LFLFRKREKEGGGGDRIRIAASPKKSEGKDINHRGRKNGAKENFAKAELLFGSSRKIKGGEVFKREHNERRVPERGLNMNLAHGATLRL